MSYQTEKTVKIYLEWEPTVAATYPAQSRAARALLHKLLEKAGIPSYVLKKTPEGRPYLEGKREVDFSLSHTKGLVVCALAVSPDGTPPRVGVDAEEIPADREKVLRLAARFFGKWEQAYVENAPDPLLAFAEVFTAKEAYSKYVGDGLAHHLRGTDTKDPAFCESANVTFTCHRLQKHLVTLCETAK